VLSPFVHFRAKSSTFCTSVFRVYTVCFVLDNDDKLVSPPAAPSIFTQVPHYTSKLMIYGVFNFFCVSEEGPPESRARKG
jgi:hypothetical protein